MNQQLILPINKCQTNASFFNNAYQAKYGFVHFGTDLICSAIMKDRRVWGSGNGVVIAMGYDNYCGNVIVIKYPDVYNWKSKKNQDVAIRYFHMQKINLKVGDKVSTNTNIGEYGGTGQYGGGLLFKHLHIEVDTDTKNPCYTPTLKSNGTFLYGRNSGATAISMLNPLHVLFCKTGAPDSQTYTTANDKYINADDKKIPTIN